MLNKLIVLHGIPGAGPEVIALHSSTNTWCGPIQTSLTASLETIALANELASVLSKMGGTINVIQGQTTPGIMFGLFSECGPLFGQKQPPVVSYLSNPTEDYIILCKHKFIKILAKDHISLERAMWKFCHLLGYRMLMPTEAWEITPALGNINFKVAIAESPPLDFVAALGSSGGLYAEGQKRSEKWIKRNRLQNSNTYSTGHSWQGIVLENIDEFNAHPEYQGSHKKLCVLEDAVKEFAFKFAEDKIQRSSIAKVVSLAISDGITGWDAPCINTHEETLYNPSDRQILLANYVQERLDLDPKNRGVRLSIQAYGATSVPPTIQINPRLVVLVTDGFYLEGNEYDDVVNSYKAMGATDFIPYSYLGIWTWFRGLPGQGKSCDLSRIASDAARAHSNSGSIQGAVLESCSAWGSSGIGYWVMAQLLNDKNITDVNKLSIDFINSAFPDVSKVMTDYYNLILNPAPLTQDLIHRMYQCLRTAYDTTQDAGTKPRLIELGIYVRYLELYSVWKKTQKVDDFDKLASHIWRSREYDVVATRLTFFDTIWNSAYASLAVKYPGFVFNQFGIKPWPDQNIPFSELDFNTYINNGLINNQLLNFIPKGFTEDLVYVDRPKDTRSRTNFVYSLHDHNWLLWMKPEQTSLTITLTGGMAFNNKGNGAFKIVEIATDETLVEIPILIKQTQTHTIPLKGGMMYRVEFTCNGGIDFSWPPGYCFTHLTDLNSNQFGGGYGAYFLIPAGTTTVGGYSQKVGTRFLNPAGLVLYTTTEPTSYFSFKIPASTTEQIFKVENMNGPFTMLTTPPGMSLHPNELLVPKR